MTEAVEIMGSQRENMGKLKPKLIEHEIKAEKKRKEKKTKSQNYKLSYNKTKIMSNNKRRT